MINEKNDDEEAQELQQIHNEYLDKRTAVMKNTQFKVDVFGDTLGKESTSSEQTTKLNDFLAEMM